MSALKSDNPINAIINKNFFIRVYIPGEKGNRLTTAKQSVRFIENEEMRIRLFKKVLDGKEYTYSFKIRKRLRIDFHSK